MPLPKRRHSATRRDKRRKNIRLDKVFFIYDDESEQLYRPHMAHWEGNSLFYKGNKLFSKVTKK
ncbi:MAG: 50S ribosomal protein L32 [Cytophagales bacterium]|nr:50S ribosomal protein L32 [Cytophagales bacterium]